MHIIIIQTVRIPMTEKPSLRKIIQIALNIGQCQGFVPNLINFLLIVQNYLIIFLTKIYKKYQKK